MPRKSSGSTGTPATQVLSVAGVPHVLRTYRHDPRSESYGLEAAHELGVAPDRVFKTLLAAAVGGKRAAMAEVARAERATGYVAGGISPLGQRTAAPTVLDESALAHDTVLVSGGRRGLDVELDPSDLVELTNARVAPIARRP